jgi:hypothetical protein
VHWKTDHKARCKVLQARLTMLKQAAAFASPPDPGGADGFAEATSTKDIVKVAGPVHPCAICLENESDYEV